MLKGKHIKVVRYYADANELLEKGHKLLKIDRDRNDRSKNIYLFEVDETLLTDLQEISNKYK